MSSQSDAAPAEPIRLTDPNEYENIVSRYDVVLVDFYADWCGPCQMMEPTIEALAEETDAAILKVDVDQFQGLAGHHDVQGIPALLVYENGEQVERMVGVQTGDALETTITDYTA